MSKTPKPGPEKRRNVYFKNPTLFEAFQAAIAAGFIKASSPSARLESLISADMRRVAPKLRKAGIEIPEALLAK